MRLGRLAGPFVSPPFPIFKVSPISIIPKSEPGKFRLLHNLSSPYDYRAVNFNIPREFAAVTYESLQDAIDFINILPQPYLAKFDIKDAFRLIPLHPDDYYLTGLLWENFYYYDRTLPMGCSSACFIFEKFSSALKYIMQSHLNIPYVVKLLDDFLIISPNASLATESLNSTLSTLDSLGVPLSHEKTVQPTQSLTFLGITLDTVTMTAQIPTAKTVAYLALIDSTISTKSITLTNLRSLLGKLQHVTSIVRSGRPFLRRLYDLTCGVDKSYLTIYLDDETLYDLLVWKELIVSFNQKSIRLSPWVSNFTISFYSDASNWGYGCIYGSSWFQGPWPPSWGKYHINIKELFPIYMAIHVFAPKLMNSQVIFYTDNKCVVDCLAILSSKSPLLMSIIRPITLTLLKYNIHMQFRHIEGKKNVLADLLSRQMVSLQPGVFIPALLRHPISGPLLTKLKPYPVTLPPHLLPGNSSIPLPTDFILPSVV